MFQKLKTIFKSKDAGVSAPADKQARNGESVLSRVTSVPKERSRAPVPLAPTEAAKPAPAAAPRPPAPAQPQVQAFQPQAPIQPAASSPEEICGVTPQMNKEEIRARLAVLYRRYNRATSSLNAKLRAEAEEMLDAVVAVREKVFGAI